MNPYLLAALVAATIVLMILERLGVPMTLELSFKGDIKRESAFLAQWGQSVATPLVGLLVWQLDKSDPKHALVTFLGPCVATTGCFVIKRLAGRVRPNREGAGRFLGPSIKHANWRESFPSSHSACAVALSMSLAHFYPNGAMTFWALAGITAFLRFVMAAHWPSDITAGIAIGYVSAYSMIHAFGYA